MIVIEWYVYFAIGWVGGVAYMWGLNEYVRRQNLPRCYKCKKILKNETRTLTWTIEGTKISRSYHPECVPKEIPKED